MRFFQTITFIIELIVYFGVGAFIAISPKKFFRDKYEQNKQKGSTEYNYCYLYENSIIKRHEKKKIGVGSAIWFVIVFSITILLAKPYLMDIPQLLTGKLTYVTDYVHDTRTFNKDMHQYAYLSKGTEVKFFFLTDIKIQKQYRIGYLNNSKRAIYCEEIGSVKNKNKVMSFPLKEIFVYLFILAIFIFLIVVSPFVKLKIYIPTTIICSIIYIFNFIRYGLRYGTWVSQNNKAFLSIIMMIIEVLLVLSMLWIQKRKEYEEFPVGYFFAQVFLVVNIGSCIELISNLRM